MKVLIGTKNLGKIEGAKKAFEKFFENIEIEGINVSSDVGDEPLNKEIYEGARNRVNNLLNYAAKNKIDADYFLGIESGITNLLGKWIIVNVAVIKNKEGYESWGTSPGFPVPDKYVNEIIKTDLGKVMDSIFEKNDLRSSIGGVSYLTKENITRIDLTEDAFIMALTQFVNNNWNDKENE